MVFTFPEQGSASAGRGQIGAMKLRPGKDERRWPPPGSLLSLLRSRHYYIFHVIYLGIT